jgi:hypothetical protein
LKPMNKNQFKFKKRINLFFKITLVIKVFIKRIKCRGIILSALLLILVVKINYLRWLAVHPFKEIPIK